MLFKDEVRRAGLELGIPENLVYRQPFPGPGLGIRIIGEVTPEKVRIVQMRTPSIAKKLPKQDVIRGWVSILQPSLICVLSELWEISGHMTTL